MTSKKRNHQNEKTCYSCKEVKPKSQMEDMGVWVCKTCLKKPKKKK